MFFMRLLPHLSDSTWFQILSNFEQYLKNKKKIIDQMTVFKLLDKFKGGI